MVAGISHDTAFGMCHLWYKGIPHHVICFLVMWYTFMTICFFKNTENWNLTYLKVKHDKNHGIKRKSSLCSMTPHTTQSFGFLLIQYSVPHSRVITQYYISICHHRRESSHRVHCRLSHHTVLYSICHHKRVSSHRVHCRLCHHTVLYYVFVISYLIIPTVEWPTWTWEEPYCIELTSGCLSCHWQYVMIVPLLTT